MQKVPELRPGVQKESSDITPLSHCQMRYPWYFLGLITFSWFGLLYINQPVRYYWLVLLPCAVLLYLWDWMRSDISYAGSKYAAVSTHSNTLPAANKRNSPLLQRLPLGLPAAAFAIVLPFPYRIGAICVLLSLLSGIFAILFQPEQKPDSAKTPADPPAAKHPRKATTKKSPVGTRYKLLCGLESALMACGVLHLLQSAVVPVYYAVFSRIHKETLFSGMITALLNLFGVPATLNGNIIRIEAFARVFDISGNWETVSVFAVFMFLAGGIALLIYHKAGWKTWAAFTGITFSYTLLRYLFVVMAFSSYGTTSVFWSRAVTTATFIPYPIILHRILNCHRYQRPAKPTMPTASSKATLNPAFLLAFCAAFAAVAFFGFRSYGPDKPGRVLVDEYHSDWEWTTIEYDENWYGQKSGYNYYCLYNLIDNYYIADRNMEVITDEGLSRCDVFLLKTPTLPLSNEEVDSLVRFVEAGGGLYLIGDHTNVFGTSTILNTVSERFGIRYNMDCTYELEKGNLSEFDIPKVLPHPTVIKMPRLLFASTCTLNTNWKVEETMIGYGLKAQPADYSQKNFFPSDSQAANQEFGLFLHAASAQYGKGKVVAFTDSTIFSNFWMYMPGKPEMLLGNIQWLNKVNILSGIHPRVLFLSIFLVLLAALAIWRLITKKTVFYTVLSAVLLAIPCAVVFFSILDGQAMPALEPRKPTVNICFEEEYSDFKIAKDMDGFLADYGQQLQTFYVWQQRLDFVPSLHSTLNDALGNGDVVVIAKPGKPVQTPAEIMHQVESGAKLLILDHTASGAYSNELLRMAGLEIVEIPDRLEPKTAERGISADSRTGWADGVGRTPEADVSEAGQANIPGKDVLDDSALTMGQYYGSALDVAPMDNAVSSFDRALGGRAIPGEREAESQPVSQPIGQPVAPEQPATEQLTPAEPSTKNELSDTPENRYGIYDEISEIPITSNASMVLGGESRLTDQFGNTVLSVQKIGKGLIAVYSDPDIFYSHEMGDVSANLTPKTELISKVHFKMMRELVASSSAAGF